MDTLERQISSAETRLLSRLEAQPPRVLRRVALMLVLLLGIAGARRWVAGAHG